MARLVSGSILKAVVLLEFAVSATVRILCLCEYRRVVLMSSDSRPCSNVCGELQQLVTFYKLCSFLISITGVWMLPSVANNSVSSVLIGRWLLLLSIAFANMVSDGSILVGSTLKFSSLVRPFWNVIMFLQPNLNGTV